LTMRVAAIVVVCVCLVALAQAAVEEKATEERTFQTPAKKKARITVISNNNVLKQHGPPKGAALDPKLLKEEDHKARRRANDRRMRQMSASARRAALKENLEKKRMKARQKNEAAKEKLQKKANLARQQAIANRRKAAALARKQRLAKQKADEESAKADEKAKAQRKILKEKLKRKQMKLEAERLEQQQKRDEADRQAALRKRQQQTPVRKQSNLQLSGWTEVSSHGSVKVERVGSLCFATGLIQGSGSIVFPQECRPTARLIFNLLVGNDAAKLRGGRVDLLPSGELQIITNGGRFLSLNGIVFNPADAPAAELLSNWVHYGYSYRQAEFASDNGLCVVTGLIRNGGWGALTKTSDACRPDARLIFAVNNHVQTSRVDALPAGSLVYAGGGHDHGWIALSNIVYTPEKGETLQLRDGWQQYGNTYRDGSWKKVGRTCVVSGLVKNHKSWSDHPVIATLPEDCRPTARLSFGTNVHIQTAQVDVLPTGEVMYVHNKANWEWLALDGIAFLTA